MGGSREKSGSSVPSGPGRRFLASGREKTPVHFRSTSGPLPNKVDRDITSPSPLEVLPEDPLEVHLPARGLENDYPRRYHRRHALEPSARYPINGLHEALPLRLSDRPVLHDRCESAFLHLRYYHCRWIHLLSASRAPPRRPPPAGTPCAWQGPRVYRRR